MTSPPDYFEEIQRRATRRWEQLEQDRELAGPWHQLFKQVQNPRHVVSELLQNADDVGATEASIRIEGGAFIFEHDGEDFTREHFASLCRFGYSNKRALHTIGFRGIGFKSTFSLGDRVEILSPTLAVRFDRARFTEPQWLPDEHRGDGRTCIRVPIGDGHREDELKKNLEEWLKSPVSLLFFKTIRRVRIGSHAIHWATLDAGPVTDSEWMALEGQDERHLLVRSKEKPFPEKAIDEIRQERMLTADEMLEFPPCRVEIVLGARGRLYVVLPTLVETALPFACNAPFIQDPSRLKIKEPGTSPTNRWLLNRVGNLAASAMLSWLGREDQTIEQRTEAYSLLPDVDRDDTSLEGVCAATAELAAAQVLDDQGVLLTENGSIVGSNQSVIVPGPILDVWPADKATALLDENRRPALARHISADSRQKLLNWGFVEEIDKQTVFNVIRRNHLPRPKTWQHLLRLWVYIAPEVTDFWRRSTARQVRIVPVQGKDVLYSAEEVVRLGEERLLQSEDDWSFLGQHLLVLNQNWTRFLAKQRRTAEALDEHGPLHEAVEEAYAILEQMDLDEASNVDTVLDQVAAVFFRQDNVALSDCVQFAQIGAKLGAEVGDSFRFAVRDRTLKDISDSVLVDLDGALEELLPEQDRETRLLHPDYLDDFKSCTREEWNRWVNQGRSGLQTFVTFKRTRHHIYSRSQVEREAVDHGVLEDLHYPYVTDHFVLEDWDFEEGCWEHWENLADRDVGVWGRIVEAILEQREGYWGRANRARLLQVATTYNEQPITSERLLPSWAIRFREMSCLQDERGVLRRPTELLRRTRETEPFLGAEPFVDGMLDRETKRPLLDLLGVRSTPTGPNTLLEFVRALAKAESPPVNELEKWYRRLDEMLGTCSTEDLQMVSQAFRSEKLIFTQDGAWATSAGVFLLSDEEDAPGAAEVRASVRDLMLWRRIGVGERPSADLALAWLAELPSGVRLPADETRRIRALLGRHSARVWNECSHWLNLAGEWVPVGGLKYGFSAQSRVPWDHLDPWVKEQTADLQRVPGEVVSVAPFSHLPPLANHIENRVHDYSDSVSGLESKAWLTAAGSELSRVEFDSEDETHRVRDLAHALETTRWRLSPGLEVVPYIDGMPAGTPRRADSIWLGAVLHVGDLPKAKLARLVPDEIGRAFGRDDIKAALYYSFERPAEDVRAYFEENFVLAPVAAEPEPEEGTGTSPGEKPATAGTSLAPRDAASDPAGADQNADDHTLDDDILEPPTFEPRDTGDNAPVRRRPSPRPAKPSIMERFARSLGFTKESEDRYYRGDGSWIARAVDSRFPWELRNASGDLERHYLPKEHCLESEPLQLDADVWMSLDQEPETYALILTDVGGAPAEVTGARLRAMRDAGEITLHQAAFRIVYSGGQHA